MKNPPNVFNADLTLPVAWLVIILATIANEKNARLKNTSVNPCRVPLIFGIGATCSDSNAASYAAVFAVSF